MCSGGIFLCNNDFYCVNFFNGNRIIVSMNWNTMTSDINCWSSWAGSSSELFQSLSSDACPYNQMIAYGIVKFVGLIWTLLSNYVKVFCWKISFGNIYITYVWNMHKSSKKIFGLLFKVQHGQISPTISPSYGQCL